MCIRDRFMEGQIFTAEISNIIFVSLQRNSYDVWKNGELAHYTNYRHSVVSIQTCVLFCSVEMLHNNEIRPITKVMGIIFNFIRQ